MLFFDDLYLHSEELFLVFQLLLRMYFYTKSDCVGDRNYLAYTVFVCSDVY